MRGHFAAIGFAWAALLASSSASALKITIDPLNAGAVGTQQTFRVASVEDAVGAVTYRWNFGDGTTTDFVPDMTATHTYQTPGHYTVIVLASDDAGRTSDTLVHAAHYPVTPKPPSISSSIVFDADRHQVWNVNPDNDSVTVIDASTMARMKEVPVGKEPHFLALAPDGTIWVTNQMSDEIVVIDRASGNVKARIQLAYASQPLGIAFGPNGMAYVSLYATGKLVEIDPVAREVRRELELGPTPAGVSVASDGRIFVTRFISPEDHGEVWVVSSDALRLTNTIDLAFDQTPDSQSGGRGVPNYVSQFVISPDGTQAWVTAKKDDTARGPQRDGLPMTSDNFVRSAVCTIDLKTEAEVLEKRQDLDNRATPVSVAFSPLGDYAYILVQPDNWIGITDAYTGLNLSGIKQVGSAPDGFVLLPDGQLMVNAFLSREVIAYDLSQSIASIDHTAPPALANIRTVDHEPLSPAVLLGKQVFFNAIDTRMGHAGYMSCVSCHFGGTSDGRVWDFTNRGEGLRNTRSLLGARGTSEGRIHWSANFNEIQDFERDIRDSFDGSGFMPDDEFNARKGANGKYDPFSKPAAGVSKELDGLAEYFRTFDKVPRSPFRNPDGSFTKDARLGRKVFERAGCPTCHSGPDFTDSSLDPKGPLHDVGTILPTSGSRLGGPLTGIDTPTLKGVWQSAPYLHDGRAKTLREIFTKYTKDQMGTVSDLTPAELDQLVRYLEELDDVPETPVPDDEEPTAGGGPSCSLGPASRDSSKTIAGSLLWLSCALVLSKRRWPRG
jgi:YVTN family beta-propeller protein